jgi:uracil-DNA glycosylase
LLRYLQAEREHGRSQIWLSTEALIALGDLPARLNALNPPLTTETRVQEMRTDVGNPTLSAAVPASESVAREKARRLREIRMELEADAELVGMESLRDTLVFAVGNPDADLMLVGEAPGAEEEKAGEPFVGPAGQLLTKIIKAMGLAREQVYISNIVKFRPKIPNQTTQNRKPTRDEMAPFRPYVAREVEVVQPKVIVALGGTAAEGLVDYEGSVGSARMQQHDFRGIPTLVTYHPSYLLRNPALSERRKLWEDCMKAMEILGMPISTKQRGFFLE